MLSFSTYHIEFFFSKQFFKIFKKIFFFFKIFQKNFFFYFFENFEKLFWKKKFYMISWKTKHFSLLTFFEILIFWNNDILFYLFSQLNPQKNIPRLIQIQWNIILKPRRAGYKNRYMGRGTFVFTVLPSEFAFWVNLHPTLWVLRVSGVSIICSGS